MSSSIKIVTAALCATALLQNTLAPIHENQTQRADGAEDAGSIFASVDGLKLKVGGTEEMTRIAEKQEGQLKFTEQLEPVSTHLTSISNAWEYTYGFGKLEGMTDYLSNKLNRLSQYHYDVSSSSGMVFFKGFYQGPKSKDYAAQLEKLETFFKNLPSGADKSISHSWSNEFKWRRESGAVSFAKTIQSINDLKDHFIDGDFLNYSSESLNHRRAQENSRRKTFDEGKGEEDTKARSLKTFELGLDIIEAFTTDIGVASHSAPGTRSYFPYSGIPAKKLFSKEVSFDQIKKFYKNKPTGWSDWAYYKIFNQELGRFKTLTQFSVQFDKKQNNDKTFVDVGFYMRNSEWQKNEQILSHAFVIDSDIDTALPLISDSTDRPEEHEQSTAAPATVNQMRSEKSLQHQH